MKENRVNYKERAKRLASAIDKMFGIKCTHSQSLELVSHEENYPSWDALSGVVSIPPVSLMEDKKDTGKKLTSHELLAQIMSVETAINSSGSLDITDIAKVLSRHSNPLIAAGWKRVSIPDDGAMGGRLTVVEVLEQTGLFDEDVLNIIRIGFMNGNYSPQVLKNAIEYVRMVHFN